jgi:PTH1 family peptidyl-tRNA hydrolase
VPILNEHFSGQAGHNGLKDISQRLGSHDYWRLRLGVGKPPAGAEGADYVLQKPAAEDKAAIDQAIEHSLQVLPEMLAGDMQAAIQKLHSGEPKPTEKKEPPKKEVPVKEPEQQPAPEKSGGLLKSLFGKK